MQILIENVEGDDILKIYISGKMTGCPDFNYPAFFAAAETIRKQGHKPINPADGAPKGCTWEQYMRRALLLLLIADEVWMLPGWQSSRGAQIERLVANQLEIPIRYLEKSGGMKA